MKYLKIIIYLQYVSIMWTRQKNVFVKRIEKKDFFPMFITSTFEAIYKYGTFIRQLKRNELTAQILTYLKHSYDDKPSISFIKEIKKIAEFINCDFDNLLMDGHFKDYFKDYLKK